VSGGAVERLPEPQSCVLLGRRVPLLSLAGFEASAPAKVRLALRAVAIPGTMVVPELASP